MENEMKTFVLDTNVLLNDPTCIDKFGAHNVVIPLVVLEEIDNFKKGNSPLAGAARHVSRELDELRGQGRFSEGVPLPSGGLLLIPNYKPSVEFTASTFKDTNDNIIVQTALNLGEKLGGVILVTEDINLRVRGSALGIECQEHKASRVQDTSFYKETTRVDVPKEVIDNLYQNDYVSLDSIDYVPFYNEYLILRSGQQSALVIAKDRLLPILRDSAYGLKPRNAEQAFALDALLDPDIKLVVLAGLAGCGKTLISIAAGLEQVVNDNLYDKMVITRPIVHMGNDLGYLPGSLEEKLEPWLAPIYDSLDFLHRNANDKSGRRRDGRDMMEDYTQMKKVEVGALNYIRGRSIPNQFILADEVQNMNAHEIKTLVTRVGEGSKLVVTGDPYQIDSPYLSVDNNALSYLIDRLRGEELFAFVSLTKGERSELAEIAARKL